MLYNPIGIFISIFREVVFIPNGSMNKARMVITAVVLMSFGVQLSLPAQVPLCFEAKAERELRENARSQTAKDISFFHSFGGFSWPAFLNQPKLLRFFSLILFVSGQGYSNFPKKALFNHSPPNFR